MYSSAHQGLSEPPIVITECGAAFDDHPDDPTRATRPPEYLATHIAAVAAARLAGADVRGYLEWAYGYEKRFGPCH